MPSSRCSTQAAFVAFCGGRSLPFPYQALGTIAHFQKELNQKSSETVLESKMPPCHSSGPLNYSLWIPENVTLNRSPRNSKADEPNICPGCVL